MRRTLLILLSGLLLTPLRAQMLHGTDPLPAFEAATIKPLDPKARLYMPPLGLQITARTVGTLEFLVALAYNVPSKPQMVGGLALAEAGKQTYVIEGKIPDDIFARMQTMTNTQRRTQVQLMLQSLLAERMKLKVHFSMRSVPVYELIIDKGGPKLPPPTDPKLATQGGYIYSPAGEVTVKDMPLDRLLAFPIFGLGERPIVNKTGLDGLYSLHFRARIDAPSGPAASAEMEGAPAISTVLQEQFGLKLVPGNDPIETLYVENIEQPSPN